MEKIFNLKRFPLHTFKEIDSIFRDKERVLSYAQMKVYLSELKEMPKGLPIFVSCTLITILFFGIFYLWNNYYEKLGWLFWLVTIIAGVAIIYFQEKIAQKIDINRDLNPIKKDYSFLINDLESSIYRQEQEALEILDKKTCEFIADILVFNYLVEEKNMKKDLALKFCESVRKNSERFIFRDSSIKRPSKYYDLIDRE